VRKDFRKALPFYGRLFISMSKKRIAADRRKCFTRFLYVIHPTCVCISIGNEMMPGLIVAYVFFVRMFRLVVQRTDTHGN